MVNARRVLKYVWTAAACRTLTHPERSSSLLALLALHKSYKYLELVLASY